MPLPILLTAALLASSTADAAPRRDQVHVQLQTSVLGRETLRVEEADLDRRTTRLGPGAGGAGIAVGYHIKAPSEVGARLEFGQVTVHDDVEDRRESHLALGAYYTHYFRLDKALRATATGIVGLERADFDGDAQARAPFVGVGGGVHWFATPRTSLSTGLELSHTLAGRYDADGVEGSSRYSAMDVALVGGVNVFLGGKKTRHPKAASKKRGGKKGAGKKGGAKGHR